MNLAQAENELWPLDRPKGMPIINSLEVMCGKDHMDVHLSFSHPFEGIVSSKGLHSKTQDYSLLQNKIKHLHSTQDSIAIHDVFMCHRQRARISFRFALRTDDVAPNRICTDNSTRIRSSSSMTKTC